MFFQQVVENTRVLLKIMIFISAVAEQAVELGTVFQLLYQLGINTFVIIQRCFLLCIYPKFIAECF